MFAYQIKQYGKQEPLFLNEIAKPALSENSIMIKVHAASLNPVDYRIRNGDAKYVLRYSMPLTLGHNFSGVVEAVGSKITQFRVGDSVYGRTPVTGAFQEYVVVGENDIAKTPKNLTLVESASVPLAGLTAYQGLFDWLQLKEKQSILILGGSGGVGHIAIQLALLANAKVYTTASKAGKAFLQQFGNLEFIDYHKEKFYEVLPQVDAVFDMRGGDELIHSFDIVKAGGKIASITSIPTPSYAKSANMNWFYQMILRALTVKMHQLSRKKNIVFHSFLTQSNRQELQKITELIESKKLNTSIQKIYPGSEINTAMKEISSGHIKGKIVVDFTNKTKEA